MKSSMHFESMRTWRHLNIDDVSFFESIDILRRDLDEDRIVVLFIYGKPIEKLGLRNKTLRRALLRYLLARFLNIEVGSVPLSILPNGKPVCPLLFFNHSNKEDSWLYGFSRKREIGVDVEKVEKKWNADKIIDIFFSVEAQKAYYSTPIAERARCFFRLWTAREALAKCLGSPFAHANYPINIHTTSVNKYQLAVAVKARHFRVTLAMFPLFPCHEPIQVMFGMEGAG